MTDKAGTAILCRNRPSYPPFAPANHPQTTYPFTCDMPSCGFFTVIRHQFAQQPSDRHPACRQPFFKPEQTCHIQPDVPIGKNAVGRQAIGNGKMTRTPVSTSRNCATKEKAEKDKTRHQHRQDHVDEWLPDSRQRPAVKTVHPDAVLAVGHASNNSSANTFAFSANCLTTTHDRHESRFTPFCSSGVSG